mmetsp:Transcript_4099/g.18400  ORF Transcript_4099/g.18400 Transcript_4099/m.18400 type:complete len:300 (-) Transcript_4099:1427-2326(-)
METTSSFSSDADRRRSVRSLASACRRRSVSALAATLAAIGSSPRVAASFAADSRCASLDSRCVTSASLSRKLAATRAKSFTSFDSRSFSFASPANLDASSASRVAVVAVVARSARHELSCSATAYPAPGRVKFTRLTIDGLAMVWAAEPVPNCGVEPAPPIASQQSRGWTNGTENETPAGGTAAAHAHTQSASAAVVSAAAPQLARALNTERRPRSVASRTLSDASRAAASTSASIASIFLTSRFLSSSVVTSAPSVCAVASRAAADALLATFTSPLSAAHSSRFAASLASAALKAARV